MPERHARSNGAAWRRAIYTDDGTTATIRDDRKANAAQHPDGSGDAFPRAHRPSGNASTGKPAKRGPAPP